jgi:glyoxylase-like metal-dependent hydrolase (beta-lactamase superfamily II)
LSFQGLQGVIASYLLEDSGEIGLIEVGPTSCLDTLLEALTGEGIHPTDVSALLVTHVHLDHAGAAGTLMRRFPRARLYVHERGVAHLLDPSKLVASATRIYGDHMDALWGAIEPTPADRTISIVDGATIQIGSTTLEAIYTPGHASHHVVYHDAARKAVFTGDVAAVRLQGHDYVRPPTPPPDIDVEVWSQSVLRVRELNPDTLYLTHFGAFTDIDAHLGQIHNRLHAWMGLVEAARNRGKDRDQIIDELRRYGDAELENDSPHPSTISRYELATPYYMSVDGLLRYLRR